MKKVAETVFGAEEEEVGTLHRQCFIPLPVSAILSIWEYGNLFLFDNGEPCVRSSLSFLRPPSMFSSSSSVLKSAWSHSNCLPAAPWIPLLSLFYCGKVQRWISEVIHSPIRNSFKNPQSKYTKRPRTRAAGIYFAAPSSFVSLLYYETTKKPLLMLLLPSRI